MFKCCVFQELIIAGRHSIVKDVEFKLGECTPGGGPLLIADVRFTIAVHQMLSMRVAALGVYGDGGSGEVQACAMWATGWKTTQCG